MPSPLFKSIGRRVRLPRLDARCVNVRARGSAPVERKAPVRLVFEVTPHCTSTQITGRGYEIATLFVFTRFVGLGEGQWFVGENYSLLSC